MAWKAWVKKDHRQKRQLAGKHDVRDEFAQDRDRILYSNAFMRLARITQIVKSDDAGIFHTRLTHTLKVAQLGRRLAEYLLATDPKNCARLGVHPEVVEAACLAHDLGHPPFGHAAEKELDRLVVSAGDRDGYEGNPQAFRILTKLTRRFPEMPGLNLTRATLCSVVKYPWARNNGHKKKAIKFGYYKTEKSDFEFCRDGCPGEQRSAEAEIMDWADDIAYSVHDIEEFHKCNAVPWYRIFPSTFDKDSLPESVEQLIERANESWFGRPEKSTDILARAATALADIFHAAPTNIVYTPYDGLPEQRIALKQLSSQLVRSVVLGIKLRSTDVAGKEASVVEIDSDKRAQVMLLKQITRDYIVNNPSLAAQQHGQKKIVQDLFSDFVEDLKKGLPTFIPVKFRHLVDDGETSPARAAADAVSSLSEAEAIALHRRLRGYDGGSILDPIVR